MNRREFLIKTAIVSAAAASSVSTNAEPVAEADSNIADQNKKTISFFVYPNMTVLDFIGPLTALNMGFFNIDYVWHDKEPLKTESVGVKIHPTKTFSEVHTTDILCVPGTGNPFNILQDSKALEWLNKVGGSAEYVTSVCTGSIILAAAGLLTGYNAATHWSMEKELHMLGAIVKRERIVIDRNRITGGGVTAGIDFGLKLLSILKGDDSAKLSQLFMQYEPSPPFNAGTPDSAGVKLTNTASKIIWGNVKRETPKYINNLKYLKDKKTP
ncbi:DJ-1/PfpI family protein [Serratia ureilytica]|uniref:DJ-1/PfpI family protein n=1 Tax=Serratia ureilytica TaxID=300181 RepID=UPI00384F02DA